MTRLTVDDLDNSTLIEGMYVGESLRTSHGLCKIRNTSVTRTPVGWLINCFQCGGKGLTLARVALPDASKVPSVNKTGLQLSVGLVRLDSNLSLHTELREAATRENVFSWEIDNYAVYYSPSTGRLVFPLQMLVRNSRTGILEPKHGGYAGKSRASGVSKWMVETAVLGVESPCVYIPRHTMDTLAGPSKPMLTTHTLVLCEDPISALKIDYSTPNHIGIAMLGLNITPALLEYVAKHEGPVILWVDGDKPGIVRGTELLKQLNFLRHGKTTKLTWVEDKDPKDLTPSQIGEFLDSFHKSASHTEELVEAVPSSHS